MTKKIPLQELVKEALKLREKQVQELDSILREAEFYTETIRDSTYLDNLVINVDGKEEGRRKAPRFPA